MNVRPVDTGWTTAGLEALTAQLEQQGWPAVHHSAGYREASRPAYRVVAPGLGAAPV